jgi:hypothetical protein
MPRDSVCTRPLPVGSLPDWDRDLPYLFHGNSSDIASGLYKNRTCLITGLYIAGWLQGQLWSLSKLLAALQHSAAVRFSAQPCCIPASVLEFYTQPILLTEAKQFA